MDEIKKAAHVEKQAVDEGELELINRWSLRPLKAEEVFTFRLCACDDQVDRDNERFTLRTLEGLARLYPGKSLIMDHARSAKGQTARIYAAGVEKGGEVNRLVLRAYMLRNEASGPTIEAIEGGILREVSVGCAVERALCSACGADKSRQRCAHIPGLQYDGKTCHVDLDGARDAYEVSFTPVPAQPGAGVVKKYGGENAPGEEAPEADAAALRLRLTGAAIKMHESEEHTA